MVRLRKSVYEKHLPKRPEMADYIEEAKQTIADPDHELVDDEAEEKSTIFHRLGLGRDAFEKCFIMVPVHYQKTLLWGEVGEVATFHLTRRIGRGRLTWTRPRR